MIRATLLLLVCWPCLVDAQDSTAMRTALDHFNEAARQFVRQDKISALRTIDAGLQRFPDDARLRKLAEELLKEDQQQQKQQQQQQDQQQEEQQDQQQAGQQQQQQNEKDKDEAGQGKPQNGDEPGQPKPKPGEIAPQDAKRILDALDRQEQQVQSKLRQRQQPAPKVPVDKDW